MCRANNTKLGREAAIKPVGGRNPSHMVTLEPGKRSLGLLSLALLPGFVVGWIWLATGYSDFDETGWDGLLAGMAGFFLAALVMGAVEEKHRAWRSAIAVGLWMPIFSCAQLFKYWAIDPTSHNLPPFELAFYSVLAAFAALLGAYAGVILALMYYYFKR